MGRYRDCSTLDSCGRGICRAWGLEGGWRRHFGILGEVQLDDAGLKIELLAGGSRAVRLGMGMNLVLLPSPHRLPSIN